MGNQILYLNPTKLTLACAESMAEHMQDYEFVLNISYVQEGRTSLRREHVTDIDCADLAFVIGERFETRHDLMMSLRERGYEGPAIFCTGEGVIRGPEEPLFELYDFIGANTHEDDLRIQKRIQDFEAGNSDKDIFKNS